MLLAPTTPSTAQNLAEPDILSPTSAGDCKCDLVVGAELFSKCSIVSSGSTGCSVQLWQAEILKGSVIHQTYHDIPPSCPWHFSDAATPGVFSFLSFTNTLGSLRF